MNAATEFLRFGSKNRDEIEQITGENSFYSVQAYSDSVPLHIYFPSFDMAVEYFNSLNRNFKALYEHKKDGTSNRIRIHNTIRRSFDYFDNIKDINTVPCKKLIINGTEAYAHFINAVLIFKYFQNKGYWRLVEKRIQY